MFRPNVIPPERRRESSLELSILRKDHDFEFFGISKVKFEKFSFRFCHCSLGVAGVVLWITYHMFLFLHGFRTGRMDVCPQ